MKTTSGYRKSERGAVAIIFGLTVVVLFAMGGVVLDLGHLYIAKAELQNAADAAALAGAKDLNETTAGINSAVNRAQTISTKNKYNFSTDVTLALSNIEFGPTPDGPWSSVAAAQATPQGKTFIKVDTGLKVLGTYLMRVAGVDTVSTFGLAVAGRFVNDITPIGVCAVDPANKTAKYTYPTGLTEIVEFGFRRGVTYDLFGMNPLGGGPSDPYLINPVDAPPTPCNPAHSSANFTAPFLCGGNSAVISSGVGQVYTNTGLSANLAESLNSRFGSYQPSGKCIAASSPPDTNVKEYPFAATPATEWMEPGGALPSQQSVELNPAPPTPSITRG
ncbi:pilus assembly protein TadG-related protein [Polaromonas sp. P1(28)-8]|nr:pilus assembly protein TadG-related protein [Polaromonas sp. P1(28)-8]